VWGGWHARLPLLFLISKKNNLNDSLNWNNGPFRGQVILELLFELEWRHFVSYSKANPSN
jgi:hypothetical protein